MTKVNNLFYTEPGNPTYNSQSISDVNSYLKGFSLRNDLEYEIFRTRKFNARTGIVFSYVSQKLRYKGTDLSFTNNMFAGGNGYSYSAEPKTTSLNPFLHFSYNDLILSYVGHSFLLNKQYGVPLTRHSRKSYYAGATFKLNNLLKTDAINRLDISVHYANMSKNSSDNYWLPSISSKFIPSPQFDIIYIYNWNDSKVKIQRTNLFSVQLNAAFLDNRVQVGTEWSKSIQDETFVTIPPPIISPGPPIFYYRLGDITTKGIAIYGAAQIINKPAFQWTTRLNVLFPEQEYDISNFLFDLVRSDYKLQAGLQNHFRLRGFYAQLNGLLGIERKVYNYNNFISLTPGSATDFILNYILVGYDLPVSSKSAFSKLSVFLQARNLAGSSKAKEYYVYDSFAGAGVHVQF